jgi:hypothetical protein
MNLEITTDFPTENGEYTVLYKYNNTQTRGVTFTVRGGVLSDIWYPAHAGFRGIHENPNLSDYVIRCIKGEHEDHQTLAYIKIS